MTSAIAIAALGLLAGVISGLFGVGGGIIFVPTLALGSWRQHRAGLVRWRTAAIIGVASVGGVLAGAELATSLSNRSLERAFGVFLVAVAVQLGWKAWDSHKVARNQPIPRRPSA